MKGRAMIQIWKRLKKENAGFTLVELMVTLMLVAILIGMSVAGIVQYQRWASWQQQEQYAKTLYTAAQSALTQYEMNGRSDELQIDTAHKGAGYGVICENNQMQVTLVTDAGVIADPSAIWSNGSASGTLYYLVGTPADYQAYKSGSGSAQQKLLYEIFDAYLYDKSILTEGCVSLEYDPNAGMVYSVLYSSRADGFSYGSGGSGMIDASVRTRDKRKNAGDGMSFGCYGV